MSDYECFDDLYVRDDGYLAKEDDTIVCYTDGAASGNHTTDGVRFSGSGVFWGRGARSDSIHYPKFGEEHNDLNTNQYAEARAALYAARRGFDVIELRTDSRFVIKSMTNYIWSWLEQDSSDGIWRTQRGTPVKHQDIWQEIHEIRDDVRINFKYVRAHVGEDGNKEADRLAVKAAAHAQSLYERKCNDYSSGNYSGSSESSCGDYYYYY